jgi:hypothetical protein
LEALRADRDVRDQLRSAELRRVIATIDGSRAQLEALAAARHNIPEFDSFCEHLLHLIYSAETKAKHDRSRR